MRQTVIFDFGGVLIDWNARHLYRKLFSDEAEMEHFLATICTPAWNAQMDAGLSFEEGVAQLVTQWPEHAALITAYMDRWDEMIAGPIEGTVALLAQLREQGTPLYGLTNWSAQTYKRVEPRYDFLSWFDGIVVSGRVQAVKPEPRIYQILLDRYAISPNEAIFIDDSPPNIATAEQLGIKGLLFNSPKALQDELTELGLL